MSAARGGLAEKCAKVVGGGLHEGGDSTIYSFIFERGWLRKIVSKDMGVAYTCEYGMFAKYGVFFVLW